MSDTVSFAELDRQHVELLPARTVMSMFANQIPIGDANSSGTGSGTKSGGGLSLSPTKLLGLTGTYGAPGTNADGPSGSEGS